MSISKVYHCNNILVPLHFQWILSILNVVDAQCWKKAVETKRSACRRHTALARSAPAPADRLVTSH